MQSKEFFGALCRSVPESEALGFCATSFPALSSPCALYETSLLLSLARAEKLSKKGWKTREEKRREEKRREEKRREEKKEKRREEKRREEKRREEGREEKRREEKRREEKRREEKRREEKRRGERCNTIWCKKGNGARKKERWRIQRKMSGRDEKSDVE